MKGLLEQSKKDGFHQYKLKVGGDLERDLRRLKLFRELNGWDDILMLDSNQVRHSLQVAFRDALAFHPFLLSS